MVAERTWGTRERPILEATVAAVDAGEDPAGPPRLAVADLPDPAYIAVVKNLKEFGYLDALLIESAHGTIWASVQGIRAKGRIATGQWPGENLGADLLAVLQQQIDATTDAEKKGRLRRLAEAVTDIGVDVVSETLAKVIIHKTGG